MLMDLPFMGFIAAEQQILEHLKNTLPDNVYKYSSPSVPFIFKELADFYPAVHVVYTGYSVPENIQRGQATIYRQNWQIVVITNNVRDLRSGYPARQEAGGIIDLVLGALNGFQLQPPHANFRPSNTQSYEFEIGLIYYSFGYIADYLLTTNNLGE